MPFDANSCISIRVDITFNVNFLNEREKNVNECRFNKMNVCSR